MGWVAMGTRILRHGFAAQRRPGCKLRAGIFLVLLALGTATAARAQVVPAGYQGRLRLAAGVAGSGDSLQYGARKMLGAGVFIDGETTSHFGIEAEGRWIEFHQRANVHAETYSIGGRYHFVRGRFEPYVKALAGFGDFNFPYNYAYGRYFVFTAGGGVEYRWTHRITIRAADLEYQEWPQFTFGSMTALNASVGLKVRIF
jgi:opacity protein-like surface antigen